MELAKRQLANFIDGQWTSASGHDTADVLDPATGETLTRFVCSTAEDVDRAVQAAARAQAAWAAKTPADRSGLLLEVALLCEEHLDELSALEALDAGKPMAAAKGYEVPDSIDAIRFTAGAARSLASQASGNYLDGATSMFLREPVGVVGAITPWNYPLLVGAIKIAEAAAVGNTVVIKPSELTPLSTARFVELASAVLPKGVVNLVLGTGPEAGSVLAEHPGVGLVSFTGSVAAGRQVGSISGSEIKPSVLELGGNAPVIVFDDADFDSAVEVIGPAGLYNAGQECMAAARVLAHRSRYDEVVQALAVRAERQRVGHGFDDQTEMGPLISEAQRARVERKLEALSAHAEVVTGGGRVDSKGFFLQPTVVANVEPTDELVVEETFGPVFTVQPFDDEQHALALANGTAYGLAASVWTRDVGRALRVAGAVAAGTVWVNDHLNLSADVPITGFGTSGYGTEFGELGLLAMTRTKHVAISRT